MGPQAVSFESCGGNHVFRYNEIFSDADHYFNDAIGGGDNFSFDGFPRNDSDIHGNRISECWDDGIEAEGGNVNVRVWGNHIDRTYVKIAVAATSLGPIYVWRNVAGVSRRSHLAGMAEVDGEDRGPFLKAGSGDASYRGGRIYVFHNTTLQPQDAMYEYTLGVGSGLADSGGRMTEVVSRNNILHIHKDWWDSISDGNAEPSNDFDFDLYNGDLAAEAGAEANGWHGVPIYAGGGALDATSPGFDGGELLAGFNDGFVGAGPDVGASEAGAPPLEFGVDAYDDGPITPGADAGPGDGDGGAGDGGGGGANNATSGCGCRLGDEGPVGGRGLALGGLLLVGALALRRRRG
jgi:MYXO-CTERM domain-containing protein